MAVWYDITQSGLVAPLQTAGLNAVRWPGGSDSDLYHWQTNTLCDGGYLNANDTFDNFMQDMAIPAHLNVAITVDYGSNAACNGPGDPTEAASWVSYANVTKNYGIKWWTVGNEEYGSWEYDLHTPKNNAATYASAVATGYYPDMKAADPTAMVGVVVNPGNSPAWDPTVLAQAKYDFVELHWYAQAPGQESDSYLLTQAPQALTAQVKALQTELTQYGKQVPIMLGELGSVYSNPGKQSSSITQALFAGQVLGEALNDGVARATWWLGYGGCSDASSGNFSSSLYGWQNFGGYMIFSDGLPESGCTSAPALARGTLLPTADAYEVASHFVNNGERMLPVTISSTLPNVRAYACTYKGSYALLLFNLSETTAVSVPVAISAKTSGIGLSVTTYGKAQYDLSQTNQWAGPISSTTGAWSQTFSVTLPPWSMSAVILN
jgi:hypothetical protein